jgi:hypothetical protein
VRGLELTELFSVAGTLGAHTLDSAALIVPSLEGAFARIVRTLGMIVGHDQSMPPNPKGGYPSSRSPPCYAALGRRASSLADKFVPRHFSDGFGQLALLYGNPLANQFDGFFLIGFVRKEIQRFLKGVVTVMTRRAAVRCGKSGPGGANSGSGRSGRAPVRESR